MGETQVYIANWKKPIWKASVQYDSNQLQNIVGGKKL